jgi:hypothetical protein
MPGGIATNLQRHVAPDYIEKARKQSPVRLELKTPEQGAATSVLLATSPQLEGVGGRYFEDCNESPTIAERLELQGISGVAAYAVDEAESDRLWDLSLDLI